MKQKGFSLAILAYIIAAIAVVGVIYSFYQERQTMVKTISEQSKELGELKEKITSLEEDKTKLTSEVKSANNRTKYMSDLKEASDQARAVVVAENRQLKEKVSVLQRQLPIVLKDSAVVAETQEERQNSLQRIETLWNIYCLYKPQGEVCQLRLRASETISVKEKE